MNSLSEEHIKDLILSYAGVILDNKSTDELSIYSLNGEIMATVKNGAKPVVLSLRCDYNLGKLLREQYESVLEGQNLNKRRFITILLTGQLSDDEIIDQIRHAYEQTRQLAGIDVELNA